MFSTITGNFNPSKQHSEAEFLVKKVQAAHYLKPNQFIVTKFKLIVITGGAVPETPLPHRFLLH